MPRTTITKASSIRVKPGLFESFMGMALLPRNLHRTCHAADMRAPRARRAVENRFELLTCRSARCHFSVGVHRDDCPQACGMHTFGQVLSEFSRSGQSSPIRP